MTVKTKSHKLSAKQTINVKSNITERGIDIFVEKRKFSIEYPKKIWQKTPPSIRQILLENITFAETHWLPLLLKKSGVKYNLNYPLFEPMFFKNHLFDMLDVERSDKKKHLSYFKNFYNLEFEFKSLNSALPQVHQIPRFNKKKPAAIIPFTLGKESLSTLALCLELGIEPVLVYCQEPARPNEEKFKLAKLEELKKKYHVKTYFIKHQPGLFRRGENLLGWGTQTTLLTLLVAPFVFAQKARYLFFGSEYSNNETEMVDGWKVFHSADQTSEMTAVQNNILRALTDNQCEVKASLEPLEEINIFYLLHHRYPQIGKYQFSCEAFAPLYQNSQWCHKCYKCCRMYLFALCCGVDPRQIGFKKDLFKQPNLFNHYFGAEVKSGSSAELDFAFYWLYKKGVVSPYIVKFIKQKLSRLKPWSWYKNYFSRLKPAKNLPAAYQKQMLRLFKEELGKFKKLLPD